MEKLVRDRIPEIIESSGRKCEYRVANKEEYHDFLLKKLDEEVTEFKESESLEELADVMEVLFALSEDIGYNAKELLRCNQKKRFARGSFDLHILLKSF